MSQREMKNKDLLPDRGRKCIFAADAAGHNQHIGSYSVDTGCRTWWSVKLILELSPVS